MRHCPHSPNVQLTGQIKIRSAYFNLTIICQKLFRNTLVAKIRDVLDLRYVRAFCVKKMLSTKKSVNGIHAPTIGEMRFQLAKTAIHICIT